MVERHGHRGSPNLKTCERGIKTRVVSPRSVFNFREISYHISPSLCKGFTYVKARTLFIERQGSQICAMYHCFVSSEVRFTPEEGSSEVDSLIKDMR